MVNVIVYGSLLSKDELERKEGILGYESEFVIVKGFCRIFNKVSTSGRWGISLDEIFDRSGNLRKKDVAVLNVERGPNFQFNGVLVRDISENDFKGLIERETNCHLLEIAAKNIYDLNNKPLEVSETTYCFQSDEFIDKIKIVRDDILPLPMYLRVCREGAYSLGDKFGRRWDEATVIADRSKTIAEYIKRK